MLQQTSNKCVLSICDISPTRCGSFEEFLIALTKKLSEVGFEHVIIFREKPIEYIEKVFMDHGAKIEVFEPSKYSLCNFLFFHKIIKRINPSIVHFHFYPIYSISNYIKLFHNIKVIHTDHMGGKKAKTKIKRILRKIYYKSNANCFDIGIDKIICVSNFVKNKYQKEYGINSKKLEVIHNGINTTKFRKNNDSNTIKRIYNINNEYIITCVGLREDKGPQYLTMAAPLIIKEIPDVKFILIGEGDYKNHLKSMVNELNIENHVIFAGNVPNLADIFSISSVVVIPSIFEEAFCFVAAEAMSTETPIVAFDSGALKEVVYDKFQIVSKNHVLLANRVTEILINGDINDKNKMRDHVIKNFPLEKCVNEYILLYKQLSVMNMSY